jgi:hypothetical protein
MYTYINVHICKYIYTYRQCIHIKVILMISMGSVSGQIIYKWE